MIDKMHIDLQHYQFKIILIISCLISFSLIKLYKYKHISIKLK